MPVDVNKITALVDELGLPDENKNFLIKSLTDPTNEPAAQRFISQRLRHDEFTRSKQDLATERQTLEQRANSEVTRYAQELQNAQDQIRRVMADFESEHISRATAEARLRKVKETYQLSDEDIPAVDPPVRTPGRTNEPPTGGLTEERVIKLLDGFEKKLLKNLGSEIGAFPRVAALLDDIDNQHFELTGKRLTYDQKQELIEEAQKEETQPKQPRLVRVYREKFNVSDAERTREQEEWRKTERQRLEDEQKRRNSEDALRGVRRLDTNQPATVSPVLGRKFTEHNDAPTPPAAPAARQDQTPAAVGGPKLSGAERAAAKFLERRAAGIPMGQAAPVGAGK